ncbi:amino acid adenylation domain-containing protein [Actinomadura sp. 9N215]|uniref:amino acid adenylation domain-containing protein n=1 Tax=Actinomadura sp. 9N215 TaxID=3375150 RepID=UPI0037ADF577
MNDRVDGPSDVNDELLQAYESLSADERDLLMTELARRRHAEPEIPQVDRGQGPPPASSAQERVWFLDQLDPGSVAYLMPGSVRLRGRLDVDALTRGLTEIVRRHEMLRTTFTAVDGRPRQVVAAPAPAPVPLPVTDLRGLPAADREAAVRTRQREEAGTPFDIGAEPGLRARLLVTGDEEHVLLVTMHHIASDGWSLGVFLRELAALYEAYVAGAASPLADLPIQYADFAAWQLGRVEDVLDAHLEYWRRYLAHAPVLELPADRPRPAVATSAGAAVRWRLEPAVMKRVDTLAGSVRATPFMVLQAAFAVLLWRWSGQEDLVIGYPIAGRPHPDLEGLIGFFANTLPLRADLGDRPAFTELLGRVRDDCADAYEHQEVPFDQIVRELHPDRSAGQVPLIQVMLALRDVPMPEFRLSGLTLEPLAPPSLSAKFDLYLDLVPDGAGGLDVGAEYRTGLFDAETVERMMRCFRVLLDGLLDDPGAPVSAAPMLDRAEAGRIVAELAGEDAPVHGTLHGLFEERADADPHAVAVLAGDARLTYRELERRANRLAAYLRDRGVGPEDVVGVCLPRSAEMVVALLGILKAGAAYVPLDPLYPRRRVSFMLSDARARLVLTVDSVAASGLFDADADDAHPAAAAPGLLLLDGEAGAIAAAPSGRPSDRPAPAATERSLAYLIYTSGSTGTPKGVMNVHGGIAGSMRGMNGLYDLTPDDRMLAISSLSFDMSVYEIFGTLAAGATVVVPSDIEITDPVQLLALLRRQGVTTWSSAPALLDMLVNHAHDHDGMPGVRLRAVALSGDRMPPTLPVRLHALVPGVRLFNTAGATEASYMSTAHLVRDTGEPRPVMNWGRPLPGHRVYVLDQRLRPTPVGVPGELYLGGAGPGRGYWRRPGPTACRFVADPYASGPPGRMYATGDSARFLPDGSLEFLGRLDHQLKIRGFRIEAGEVEAAVAAHPAVVEPVVTTYEQPGADRVLVAYLTTRDDGDPPPSAAELRRFLEERLPRHMVPAKVVFLDELPRLPNGKLNRAALPDPFASSPSLDTPYAPPDGPLERVLADLLSGVLEVEKVGALDDFFDLGGHSLLATQAVSRIRELFRVGLTIPVFLGAGRVRELAQELRDLGMRGGVDVDAVAEFVLQVAD